MSSRNMLSRKQLGKRIALSCLAFAATLSFSANPITSSSQIAQATETVKYSGPNTMSLIAQGTVNYVEEDAIDVMYDVEMVPQQTRNSCWAAAAAMIISWRDQAAYSPWQLANSINRLHEYKHKYRIDDRTLFQATGMVAEPPQTYTVHSFANLLNEYGPLWVATHEDAGHVRVVTGISGDGTLEGTDLFISDPQDKYAADWSPDNTGSEYTESYATFVRKQAELARRSQHVDNAFYVAHLR